MSHHRHRQQGVLDGEEGLCVTGSGKGTFLKEAADGDGSE